MKKIASLTLAAVIGLGSLGFVAPSASYAAGTCASIEGPQIKHYLGKDCFEDTLYFDGGGDTDTYYFHAEAGAKVNFWLERGVNTDFTFTVINPDGEKKPSTKRGTAQELRGFKTNTDGIYKVTIHSNNGYDGRDFKLKVRQTNY